MSNFFDGENFTPTPPSPLPRLSRGSSPPSARGDFPPAKRQATSGRVTPEARKLPPPPARNCVDSADVGLDCVDSADVGLDWNRPRGGSRGPVSRGPRLGPLLLSGPADRRDPSWTDNRSKLSPYSIEYRQGRFGGSKGGRPPRRKAVERRAGSGRASGGSEGDGESDGGGGGEAGEAPAISRGSPCRAEARAGRAPPRGGGGG